ncbi:MAG: MucBP domain-containing protein [Lactococcus chungangensis]|nr:MucBP domain-containing protein [Lactococcus chungangensis]
MKFKTGIVLILSATTIGIDTSLITTSITADAQEEKSPTLSSNSVTQRTVTVYPSDFLTYFQRNGSAANFNYDIQNFVQTLTPNMKDQSGNVTLKTKVDMSQNFTLSGSINLGDKSSESGGADGVGFLFHPGNTDVVGVKGGAAGIGGVKGAFGFKLDTYYNYDGDPYFYPDPREFSPGQAYGAFVDGTSGVAQTLEESAQPISQPSNNQFKPFKMSYDGTSKMMTVTYDGKIWQQDVSNLIGTNQSMAFSISASTGDNFNLQQLQLSNFQYTIAQGTVHANYLDENGQTLKATITTSGDIDTLYTTSQVTIPGYTFERVTGAAHIGTYQANAQDVNYIYKRNQDFATITYIDDTTGQVLTHKEITGATGESTNYTTKTDIATFLSEGYQYVSDNYPKAGVTFTNQPQNFEVHLMHKSIATTETKQVKEVIHYQYKNGKQALNNYVATPLTFTRTVTTDQVIGSKTYGDWMASSGTSFEKVTSPSLKNYTPDVPQVAAIDKVSGETKDIVKTVIYMKVPSAVKIPMDKDKVAPHNPSQPSESSKKGQTPSVPVTAQANKKELPDTGAKNGIAETILGVIVFLATAGWLKLRKNQE